MNLLLSTLLLLMLLPQDQKLPDAVHQLPEEVRNKATLIFTGTYSEGRGPCLPLPNGGRVWALESWFTVKKVYLGKVGSKSIRINSRVSPKINDVSEQLKVGRDYLVLLRPSEETLKLIEAGEYVRSRDAPYGEEIIAIVELE